MEIDWRDFTGVSGAGITKTMTDDTGAFRFFERPNLETIIKVLDARAINWRFWVFYGSLTNVGFTLRVRDSETGM